ncbi:MAG: hypothetical protein CME70_06405 [Halobacteriovorax sp.]|nr:hypothetical protein [Halobacteriovorax sp.]|tara:strand:- start:934 stop:1683 length:750 start_codon:yes stop_codon:yes gene_type:complete
MLVTTVMNYSDEKEYNLMCKGWIKYALLHFPDSEIAILTKGLPPSVQDYANENNINVMICSPTDEINFGQNQKATHNVCFKLFNLCKLSEKFIFIDADAFIVSPGSALIKASGDQGFIAVNHQLIPGHTDHLKEPVLNSGVMAVSDIKLFRWENFKSILHRDRGFVYPGTDQSLINSYFKGIGYDYTHKDIGFGWNSWAAHTKWEEGVPFCRGLNVEHPVHINHYWYDAKPWNINCPLYKSMINNHFRD